jgi:hypothetical protein
LSCLGNLRANVCFLLQHFAGVIEAFLPADIADVDHALETVAHVDERAKLREAGHGTSTTAPTGYFFSASSRDRPAPA